MGKLFRGRSEIMLKKVFSEFIEKFRRNPDNIFYIFFALYSALMLVLCYFRDIVDDEGIYFHEAWLMSEVLKSGEWFGNYAVGLHGFLSKIPISIIFIFTGPSVDVVTLYTIIIGLITSFLFFQFCKKLFKNKWYAVFSTIFVMTSFHFVLSMPTFLRDIPSLLIVVLLLNAIYSKWNKYILSILFLLLLDAKDYVFLVFGVFYIIWLFIDAPAENPLKRFFYVARQSFFIFLPSLVWIVLMFTTSIIPINMYLASLFGLIDGNLNYTLKHFSTEIASTNLLEDGKNISLVTDQVVSSNNRYVSFLIDGYNFVMSYVGKVLYPRSFSFISIPKVVIFPLVFSSVSVFIKYLKTKEKKFWFFASAGLLNIIWLIFYILRASHGRYLLPILPSLSIIFIYFLFFNSFNKKEKIWLFSITAIYVTAGFFFETSYLLPKIALEILLLCILFFVLFKKKFDLFKYLFISLVSIFSLGVALLFSYTQGQINASLNWGRNREAEKIVQYLPTEGIYWDNNFQNQSYISVLNNELYSSAEWKWNLKDIVPKKSLLLTKGEQKGFNSLTIFDNRSYEYAMPYFKEEIISSNVTKLYLLSSTIKGDEFAGQHLYEYFVASDWLTLKEEINLKNKILYIFDVKY